MDSPTIPFDDASFDAVFAWQVLYYNNWNTLRASLIEINRVLRTDGLFLGTMAAPGDYSHTHGVLQADGTFRSEVPGQEGATVVILPAEEISKFFSGKNLITGYFGFEFGERHGKHWIVSYQKQSSASACPAV